MISKYLKYQPTIILMLLLSITGCKDNTDIDNFNKTPSERLATVKSDLKQALISSKDGWKMIYFPNDSEFGGFAHLMSFTEDGKVKMASDFNESSLIPEISEYEIQMGYSAALVFTTRNKIHLLSDSENSPGKSKGSGYGGSFEFVLDKIDENGNIHFKASRGGSIIIFTKASAKDWDNLKNNFMVEKNAVMPANPFSASIDVKNGEQIKSYSFTYNNITRYLSLSSTDSSDTLSKTKYGIGFKENTVVFSPALKVGNDKVSELVYDNSTDSYTAKGLQSEVALKFRIPLDNPQDFPFVQNILAGKLQNFYHMPYTSSSNEISSVAGRNAVESVLDEAGNKIFTVSFSFNRKQKGSIVNVIEYTIRNRETITHYVDVVKGENNTIILKHKSWSSTLPIPESLKPLDNYLLDPQGLLIRTVAVKPSTSNSSTVLSTLSLYSTINNRNTIFTLKLN